MPPLKYKVGNTYKKLTILERIENRDKKGKSRPIYKCECSCGLNLNVSSLKMSLVGYCGIRGRHRKFKDNGDYIQLELSNGKYTKIDKEDFEKVRSHCWVMTSHDVKRGGYVHANIRGKYIKLHKFVTGFSFTDHINRDTLDNRKVNLRQSDYKHNATNTSKNINIKFNGKEQCLMEWSRELGINRETLRYNFHKGKHIELMNKYSKHG